MRKKKHEEVLVNHITATVAIQAFLLPFLFLIHRTCFQKDKAVPSHQSCSTFRMLDCFNWTTALQAVHKCGFKSKNDFKWSDDENI